MKIFGLIVLLLVTSFSLSGYPQPTPQKFLSDEHDLLALPVSGLQMQEANIHLTLSKIAYQYDVPIGLEVSPQDDLSTGSMINLRIDKGTLREVLDAITTQNTLYAWEMRDNVINVFPKDGFRDQSLKAISVCDEQELLHHRRSGTTRS